jgi:hypothetical protein
MGERKKTMKLPLKWNEVVGLNMPEQPKITEEIRRQTIADSGRFRGGVRLATGTFWTNDEYEKLRTEVMNTPLP